MRRSRLVLLLVLGMLTALLPLGAAPASADTAELFMSEYIEGSGVNKAVEIYNGTGASVDLATGAYTLDLHSNGAATPSQSMTLSGSIADGEVYVLANSGADPLILAEADDTNNSVINFNGDDGIVLRKDGVIIDAFGQLEVDPGSQWPGGGQNDTLRRKAVVCAGDTNFTDAFDASAEWDVFAEDTFDGLGSHTADCNGTIGPADPVINEFSASTTGTDVEYVEIFGTAATDYSAYTVLEIEGDSTSAMGTVDEVVAVGTTDASGLYLADLPANALENGTVTLLLVESFTGAVGNDLDTDDDGAIDSTPWAAIVDAVAVNDGGAGDLTYGVPALAGDYDGVSSFAPGGASRIPDGFDSDAATDWVRNDFDLAGITGFAGTPVVGEAINTPGAANEVYVAPPLEIGACADPATMIHDIQGAGSASPLVGQTVVIEGIVTGDFEGSSELRGFFMQEESTDFDADAATSEGIFVYNDGTDSVGVGDTVRALGTVTEFFGLTELTNGVSVKVCAPTGTTASTAWPLPVANVDDWERVEGMEISINETLYASGNFTQARFGEVDLSINGPLDNPTNVVAPGAAANALQDLNDRSRIQLDDGSTVQNPAPLPPYLGPGSTLRTGDTIPGLTGVVSYGFGFYEMHPTSPVNFTRANVRPDVPDVGGTIQVAAYNVLNYFTTIDNAGPICGPAGNQGCRGADTASEFTRQRDKLVTAISTLDADVVGLMEIENHPSDVPTADLVAGLNAATAAGTYEYIATGAVGSDAIRQAVLYQPAAVTPVGGFETLDSVDNPLFDDTLNRPMLVQTFVENATGAVFTVGVNHLKSKGSNCDTVGDPDTGDGQGNCNITRTNAAQAIVDYMASDPTGSGDGDSLIIGDLNAYAMENPVTTIEAGGYTDLIETFVGSGVANGAYSFNFFSQSGYLDHGLSSGTMTPQVTGAGLWHVNADEPSGLDYNNFNQPGLYNPDEWRASDHDPVIVGLELTVTPLQAKSHAVTVLDGLLPTGSSKDDKRIKNAIKDLEKSLKPAYWVDDFHLTDKGTNVFVAEKRAVKDLLKVTGTAKGEARAVIDILVAADRTLAVTVIAEAEAAGAETKWALRELAKGDRATKPDMKIDRYKWAWKEATKALGNVEVRFATFNASMNRDNAGELVAELAAPGSPQPATIAEIIQRSNPDVLLINEFDYEAGGVAAQLFQDNYLSVSQNGADPVEYPYWYVAPSNTGIYSGFDLDNSGTAGDFVPNDSFGFGFFEGQFGMAVASKYPINWSEVRTFQNFLWKDMPGALLPDDPAFAGPADWYSPEELDVFRLSSKSHWDIPIVIGNETVHFLTSHPTPPVFDGPEDRNGTRNHDEIRFWADYVKGGGTASYIYDDNGGSGGLANNALFVIAGDQNSDPLDGDSIPGAIQQLLDSPKVNTKETPSSHGAVEQDGLQGGINEFHLSDPAFDTADFSDSAPGNLRVDYVLPRKNMKIKDAAVFWPESVDPLFPLVGTFPFPSSDHRLVWIDVKL